MAIPRRGAAPAAPLQAVDFGSKESYSSGGFLLPKGDWIAADHQVVLQAPIKKDGTRMEDWLGVMVTFLPLDGDESLKQEQFFSLGQKAKLTWAPHPEHGKGLMLIPGGPAAQLNDQTNWAIYLQSLKDCGLPEGIFTNDLTVLDGMWVRIGHQPEPESRKSLAGTASTGEAAPAPRQPKSMCVAIAILDGGAPWEGGGGIPEVKAAAKPNGRPAVAAKPAARPAAAKPAAPAKPEPAEGELDNRAIIEQLFTDALEANPDGMPKLGLKSFTFKALDKAYGKETAQSLVDEFFDSQDTLNGVLGSLGYEAKGPKIVAA
jgi:hypothetical protein